MGQQQDNVTQMKVKKRETTKGQERNPQQKSNANLKLNFNFATTILVINHSSVKHAILHGYIVCIFLYLCR